MANDDFSFGAGQEAQPSPGAPVGTATTTPQRAQLAYPLDPESKAAIKEALGELLPENEFFIPVTSKGTTFPYDTDGPGQYTSATTTSLQQAKFVFRVPANFTALRDIKIVMIPDTTETIQWDLDVNYSGLGEVHTVHSGSYTNRTTDVVINVITEVSIINGGIFDNLSANDYVGIAFLSDTDDLRILGLRFTYS